jgi:alkaline phosphatase D
MKARQLTRRAFLAASSTAAVAACSSESNEGEPGATTGQGGAGGSTSSTASGEGGSGDGGAGGGMPYEPGPEPADVWTPGGSEDSVAFAWGVQTGDAFPESVIVSVRTLEPTVTLTVMKGVANGWEEESSGQSFTPVDGVVQLELTQLTADTTYSIAFYAEDGTRRTRPGRFRTALPAGESRVIRFGASSCLGDNNDPWPCLSQSVAERLDFFLLLGDAIYADNNPDQFNYVEKFKTALSRYGLKDLTAGTSIVVTWDDHEIDNNWSWSDNGIQAKFDDAILAYRQALPQRDGAGTAGIWRKLSWGDALDLFVLDCRAERENGNYISPEQLDWLKQELSNSTATFKVILNSVPIFDFTGTVIGPFSQGDRWQGYPTQRDDVLGHVADEGLTGVVWVSGDVHFGMIGQVDTAGGAGEGAWDVLVGPAGSLVNPSAVLVQESARMPVVIRNHNYCLFEADPAAGTLLCRYIDDDGDTLAEHTLQLV